MFGLKLIKISLESIAKNKLRSFLTILGIIIGVSAVIIMISIGLGAQREIEARIASLGTNLILVTPGTQSTGGVRQAAGSFSRLTIEDYELIKRESTYLDGVSPVIFSRGQIIGGDGNWNTTINGVSLDYLQIRFWELESGYFFTESDLKGKKKVCVLGKTVSDNLFPNSDPVGQKIRIRNVPFEVIGVLTEKGQSAGGSDSDDIIIAPFTTVKARLSGRNFIPQIMCSAMDESYIDLAQEEVRELMRIAHNLDPYIGDEDNFTVRNQSEITEAQTESTQIMTTLLASIAGVSLLVGGIGIMNIMLVSVTERTREIGIRMALGARESDILIQFLVEAVVLSLFGGMFGIILGFGGIYLVEILSGLATAVDTDAILLAFSFSGVIGILFGFLPARKAAALNPIDALQFQ